MNRYVFYSKPIQKGYSTIGIELDAFYQLSTPKLTGQALKGMMALCPEMWKEDAHALKGMDLRSRFAMTDGPFVIEIDGEISPDELQTFLDSKFKDGTLEEFLKEASSA
jgi:hypothetical protein